MRIDEFESVFRSALDRDVFKLERPPVERVLLISDLSLSETEIARDAVRGLLAHLELGDASVIALPGQAGADVPELVARVSESAPQLIVTWRLLGLTRKGEIHSSLGATLDTLTQETDVPVLVLPDPSAPGLAERLTAAERVLVVTDQLTGDDRLVNWGVQLTPDAGTLVLAHVEDARIYERYMDAISRVTGIDTEVAREQVASKLLEMPRAYIETVASALVDGGIQEHIIPAVSLGHPLEDYADLVQRQRIQLLICNTKDPGQRAMAALAYALAVEIQDLPILML